MSCTHIKSSNEILREMNRPRFRRSYAYESFMDDLLIGKKQRHHSWH
jgi:hypothetical protein